MYKRFKYTHEAVQSRTMEFSATTKELIKSLRLISRLLEYQLKQLENHSVNDTNDQ